MVVKMQTFYVGNSLEFSFCEKGEGDKAVSSECL